MFACFRARRSAGASKTHSADLSEAFPFEKVHEHKAVRDDQGPPEELRIRTQGYFKRILLFINIAPSSTRLARERLKTDLCAIIPGL